MVLESLTFHSLIHTLWYDEVDLGLDIILDSDVAVTGPDGFPAIRVSGF